MLMHVVIAECVHPLYGKLLDGVLVLAGIFGPLLLVAVVTFIVGLTLVIFGLDPVLAVLDEGSLLNSLL